MIIQVVLFIVFTLHVGGAYAQTGPRIWVSPSGSDANSCASVTGDSDPGVYRATPAGGQSCLASGGILTIKAGTYTGANARLTSTIPSGTAGNPTLVEGEPSDSDTCGLLGTCSTIIMTTTAGGNTLVTASNLIIRRMRFDNTNNKANYPLRIQASTNVLVENVETHNTLLTTGSSGAASGIMVWYDASHVTLRRVWSHHNGNTNSVTSHGVYFQGDDGVIEDSVFSDNASIGVQCYNSHVESDGRADRCIMRRNIFRDNGSQGVAIEGVDSQFYQNLVYRNGRGGVFAGYGGADRAKIHNNTIIDNNQATAQPGVYIDTAPNSEVMNNIIIGHNAEVTVTANGTGTTTSYNACTSTDSCGSTGKVTITSAGQWLVDPTNGDFTLKAGSNDLVNAGTTVSTRPSPVGTPDIGAYERGLIASAAVVSGFIELTASVLDPGIYPASGITGVTIACNGGGCAGTPVASLVVRKAGSSNLAQITVSGLSSPGNCTVSLGTSNLSDSVFIGGITGSNAQLVNTISSLSVTGTCVNTGVTPPASLRAHYLLDEGSGTAANDSSGNLRHGTLSSGITWSASGITIPTDTTYRHLDMPFGASTNMGTAEGATCSIATPDASSAQKVLFSSGANGSNQRLYVGWYTVSGQRQWGIGIQSSGFSTGSEFPVVTQETLVCLTWSSGTATLWVNGVKGAQSGKSVKTYTSFTTTATNWRYGNDGTNTNNNGGYTLRAVYVWDTLPSDSELIDLYDELFPTSSGSPCYLQKTHAWESPYTVSGSPVAKGTIGGDVNVVESGAVALVVQVDCIGSAGDPVALTFFYSTDGTNFDLIIPTGLGVDGIAVTALTAQYLNNGLAECCITGALTAVDGPTLISSATSPTITLAQNSSYTIRILLQVGSVSGSSFWIKLKQDSGASLAGGYTPSAGAKLNVVSPQASAGP